MRPPQDDIQVQSIPVQSTGYYALRAPIGTIPSAAPPLVLGLHGWGQHCRKMLRDLAPMSAQGILTVAAQAPHPLYLDMESGKVGFHWLTRFEKDRAIADVNDFLARLLDTVAQTHQYDPARVYILGFSQGCSMAWRFAVGGRHPVAGVIGCGADLPPDVAALLPQRAPGRILLVHGSQDGIIAIQKFHEAAETLTHLGLAHDTHLFDGGHEIPAPVAEHIGRWVTETAPNRPV